MLLLKVPAMAVPHNESDYRSRCPEPGRDVVAGDNIRLSVGWEGEDGNPGGEDVSKRVHLCENINFWPQKEEKGSTDQGRDVRPLFWIMSVHLVHPGPGDASRCSPKRSKI